MIGRRDILLRSGLLAAAFLFNTAYVAAGVRWLAAAPMRRRLDFEFAGIPASVGEAAAIFGSNLGLLSWALLGSLLLGILHRAEEADPSRLARALAMWVRGASDVLLVTVVNFNALVIGCAVGAYGDRMVSALLPHAPFELAAFALGGGLYLCSRRRSVQPRIAVITAASSLGLLALAAGLEVFA